MMKVVVDTNVLLVANEQHDGVGPDCVAICVRRLLALKAEGVVVVDDGFRILGEYLGKTRPNASKGAGDKFLKWLLQNTGNPSRVQTVSVTERETDHFDQFPDHGLQREFDPPDRKFVAVANGHPDKPPIWQAADCKWLHWYAALAVTGISVDFLCPEDVCKFYEAKFPGTPLPALPGG